MVFRNPTKIISSLLSVVLFLTNCALVHSAEVNIWSDRRKNQPVLIAGLPQMTQPALSAIATKPALANAYGSIRKSSPSASHTKTVIHVQDVHQNLEAQENIGKAIQEWSRNQHVGLIALEGASGNIDLKRFQNFSDQNVIRTVSNYLLKQNRISGPIHMALTNGPSSSPIAGIDDETHYLANIEAYKQAAKIRKEQKTKWSAAIEKLHREKSAHLNSELQRFDARVQSYRNDKISLSQYLKQLKMTTSTSSMVDIFLEALAIEEHLNFKRAEAERAQLLPRLVAKLDEKEANAFTQASIDFKAGTLRQADFYRRLSSLCSAKAISLPAYPALQSYIHYITLSEKIDAEKLFADMRTRETTIYASLTKTPKERELIQQSNHLHLVGKLLDFGLTSEEWKEYKETPPSLPTSLRGEEFLRPFEAFYEEAEIRDHAMAENLVREMGQTKATTTILVTGGFHSKGINQALTKAGINTVTFVPKISKIDDESGTHYLTAFTQERSLLDQLLDGKKLFLALPPADGVKADLPILASALTPNPQATLRVLAPGSNLQIQKKNDSMIVTNPATNVSRGVSLKLKAGEIVEVVVQIMEGKRSLQFPFVVKTLEALTNTGKRVFAGLNIEWRGWLTKPLFMLGTGRTLPITGDVFTQEGVDSVMQSPGLDHGQLAAEFEKFGFYEYHLAALRNAPDKAAAIELILSKPYITAISLPMAYNAVSRFFSIAEFINLFLDNSVTRQHEKATYAPGILLWLSLLRGRVGNNGIQSILDRLIAATQTDVEDYQRNFSKHLALNANFWLSDVAPSWARERMREMVAMGTDYAFLHFVPWSQIPNEIQQMVSPRLQRPWDDIEIAPAVYPVKNQDLAAGTCPWCPLLHWDSLMDPKSRHYDQPAYGKVGIIRVNGRPLFSLKLHRNPSMVALQTTRTPDGRFATLQGALYVPPKAVREMFSDFDTNNETFRVVDINEPLDIMPIGWIDFTSYRERWSSEKLTRFRDRLSELAQEYSTQAPTRSITANIFAGAHAGLKNVPLRIVFAPATVAQELLHVFFAAKLGLPTSYRLRDLFGAVNINYDRAPPAARAFVRLIGPVGNLLIGLAGLPFLAQSHFSVQYFFLSNLIVAILDLVVLPALSQDLYNRSDVGQAINDFFNTGSPQFQTTDGVTRPAEKRGNWRDSMNDPMLMVKKRFSSGSRKEFSDKDIQSILKGENTTLEVLIDVASLARPDEAAEIKKIRSREQALAQVPLLAFTCAELFPLVYNQMRAYLSVQEFLILILRHRSTQQRTAGLVRWWPLIQPRLDDRVELDLTEFDDDIILNVTGLINRLQKVDLLNFYTNLVLSPNAWLESINKDFAKEIFREIVRTSHDFPIYHLTPYDKIPEDLKKLRPYRLPSSLGSLTTIPGVTLTTRMEQYAGNCQDCQRLHWETLMDKTSVDYGNTAIVRVQGRALFAMKLAQDPSMVALETTRDEQGRLLTIKGGVYTSKQIRNLLTSSKVRGKFLVVDVREPVRIYPLAWIDSASNGNMWDKTRFNAFLKRLDAVRTQFSGRDPNADALSLLQLPAELLIKIMNWKGRRATALRWSVAFALAPFLEELFFRSVMIGSWGWNPLWAGFLFFILHVPQNILFSIQEAAHATNFGEEARYDEFLNHWQQALTVRIIFHMVGTLLLTSVYSDTRNLWLVVGIHSGFNMFMRLMNVPNGYLSLLGTPSDKTDFGEEDPIRHHERHDNIRSLARVLQKDPESLGDAYDAMVRDVYRHVFERDGIFPSGFSEAKITFHRSVSEGLSKAFGLTAEEDEKPVDVVITTDEVTVRTAKNVWTRPARTSKTSIEVLVGDQWTDINTYLSDQFELFTEQPLSVLLDELETGGVFNEQQGSKQLIATRTGKTLTMEIAISGEVVTSGITPDSGFSFADTVFGYHFHPRSEGAMSDGDKEEFAQRQRENGRKAVEVIFVEAGNKPSNNIPISTEFAPIFLPITLPGTNRRLVGLLYVYDHNDVVTREKNRRLDEVRIFSAFANMDPARLPYPLAKEEQAQINERIKLLENSNLRSLFGAALAEYESDTMHILMTFLGIKPASFVDLRQASVIHFINGLPKGSVKVIPIDNYIFVVNETPLRTFDPREWPNDRWNMAALSDDTAVQAEVSALKKRFRARPSLESFIAETYALLRTDNVLPGLMFGFGLAASTTFQRRMGSITNIVRFDLDRFEGQAQFHDGFPLHTLFLPDMVLPENLNEAHIQTLGTLVGHILARISPKYFWHRVHHGFSQNQIPPAVFLSADSLSYLQRAGTNFSRHLLAALKSTDPDVGTFVTVPFVLPPALINSDEPGFVYPIEHLFSYEDGENHISVEPPALAQHPLTHSLWKFVTPGALRSSTAAQAAFTAAFEFTWLLIPNILLVWAGSRGISAQTMAGIVAVLNAWFFAAGHKKTDRASAAMIGFVVLGSVLATAAGTFHLSASATVAVATVLSHFVFDRRRLSRDAKDMLPAPNSLDLRNFYSKLQEQPDELKAKPEIRKLTRALWLVKQNGMPVGDALSKTDLLPGVKANVVILSADKDTLEVRRQLDSLQTKNSRLFVVVEGKSISVANGRLHATDLEAALQTLPGWRFISAESVNVISPSSFDWVADLNTDSPLARVKKVLILEDLLKVLSFLTSRQPSIDMLLKAAEAVSKSA